VSGRSQLSGIVPGPRREVAGAGHLLDPGLQADWDARTGVWDEVSSSAAFLGFRDAVLSAARVGATDTVVDLGSGTGLLARAAAARARRVVAVDVSASMLDRLGQHAADQGLTGIELVHGDMRRLPLPDESVDVVVSCYAFHHLVDDGKELVAAEAYRVLRPGGRFVVVDMMFRLSWQRRDRRIIASKVGTLIRRGVPGMLRLAKNAVRVARGRWEHPSSIDWWQQMVSRRGFELTETRELAHEAGLVSAVKPASTAER
jgi:ubiquinone/menaquinone biosynthesis C-methylase UbiE